ncbi:MAG: hypothetical protein HY873_13385 [Chloroflexi bacterium]|nr:hypothetical protein [Chloroflexota bacterium]
MAVLFLLVAMFGIAVFRVYLPMPTKVEGKPLGKISLAFNERLLLQRTNLYLIGAVILVGAIGRFISGPIELVAILATLALLLIPGRYTFTSEGIAFNNVVFRSWTDFTGFREERTALVLQAVEGQRDFRLHLVGGHRAAAKQAVARHLSAVTGGPARRARGGRRSAVKA